VNDFFPISWINKQTTTISFPVTATDNIFSLINLDKKVTNYCVLLRLARWNEKPFSWPNFNAWFL